ncbi:hypothetical protein LPJ66_009663 [Kickxella alabastrina]|uniref:Uncharacterized protein n=1 Tax=Kickxella alabastrina TaxID=61397 RepID=A0ACC1I8U7_9FUNG|nr:hypothetical protein LPJ66_009663 [Kickxella alabastrina]
MKTARSFMDLENAASEYAASEYAAPPMPMPLAMMSQPLPSFPTKSTDTDIDAVHRPVRRRFQVVTIPMDHKNCTPQKGYVRAFYETYEEVREFEDGSVEWSCIHHSDFSGWLPGFMADHSIASAFPKEGESFIEYIAKGSAMN